jgi:hypothetical protein
MNGHDWGSTAGRGRPSRHIQWVPVVRTSRHDAKLHSQQNLIVLRSTKVKTEWNWCSVVIVNDFLCLSFTPIVGRVGTTTGSYFGDHGFKCRPGRRLYWMKLSPSPGLLSDALIIQGCIDQVTAIIVKWTIICKIDWKFTYGLCCHVVCLVGMC